jgi:ATP-dependent exoDNAse (exonuclease V) beta subunit
MSQTKTLREIVEAGAGCGKTTSLVARYIAALGQSHDKELRKKYSPPEKAPAHASEILALTFTNEAARQMQERILKALREQGSTLEARSVQEESQISTYHSFCLKILQPHLHKLGYEGPLLSPNLAAHMRKEAILRALASYPKAVQLRKTMSLPLLIQLSLKYWFHPLEVDPSEKVRRDYALFQERFENFRRQQLSQAEALLAQLPLRNKKAKADTWLHRYTQALRDPSPENVSQVALRGLNWIKDEAPEFYKALQDYRKFFKEGYFEALLPESVDEEVAAQKELWNFLKWALPQMPKIFDFEAAEVELLRLLQDFESKGQRLLTPPRLILVDEFQDTNTRQFEILQKISDVDTEWYFVGDPKQSIYAFRGGDVSLFYRLRHELTRLDKDTNYRSECRVLQYVNQLQSELFQPTLRKEDPPPQILKWPDGKSLVSGNVNFHWLDPKASTLKYTCDLLKKQRAHFENASTAILFRSWKKLYHFADMLRDQGIGYRIAGTENPFHHLLSELFARYLISCDNPNNLEGFWALERWSRVRDFKFSELLSKDELQKVYAMNSRSWTASFHKFCEIVDLERFENASAWATAMERWIKARVEESFPTRLTRTQLAHWLLKNVSSLEADDPYKQYPDDAHHPSLTLLTVHASKGLEFQHVYLPELFERFHNHSQEGFEGDEGEILTQLDLSNSKGEKRKSLVLQNEKLTRERIKDAEERRLLYVALTRAIESVNIVAHQPKDSVTSDADPYSIIGSSKTSHSYWHKSLWQIGDLKLGEWNLVENYKTDPIPSESKTDEEIQPPWILPEDSRKPERKDVFHRCGVSRYLKTLDSQEDETENTPKSSSKGKTFDFAKQDEVGTLLHRILELWNGESAHLDFLLEDVDSKLRPQLALSAQSVRQVPELQDYWSDILKRPTSIQREFEVFLLSEEFRLSGFADVAWFKSPEELVIIDWKSGSSLSRLQTTERLEKFRRQLDLYASAFETSFPKISKIVVGIEVSEKPQAKVLMKF